MREAFEKALSKDMYDQLTHLAYADWLSENGFDDEAEHHRLWTPEWQRAWEELEEMAKEAGQTCVEGYGKGRYDGRNEWVSDEEVWKDITPEMLLEAGDEWLRTYKDSWGQGNHFVQVGSETLRDRGYYAEFWRLYQIIRRVEVDEDKKTQLFSCTC